MNEDSNSNNPDSNSNPIPSPSSTNPILASTSNPSPSLPSSRSAEQNQEQDQDNSYSNQSQDSLNSNLTSSSSLTDNSDVSNQDHQPSSPNPSTTTSVSTSSSKPGKKHRTVRSLTRQYESDNKNHQNLSLQSFPSSSTPTTSQSPSPSNSTSPTNLSPTNLHHHSRRPSAVLLASATYPSTLNSDPINQTSIYSRARTSSSTSINSTSDKRIRTTSTTSNHKNNNNNRANSSSPSNRSLTLPTVESSPSSNHKSTSNSINSIPNQSSSLVASPTESSTSMTGLPILSVSQDEDHSGHSHHHHHHHHHEKETSSSSSSSTSTTGTSLKPSTNQDDDEEEEGMDSIAELSHSSSSSSSVGGGGGGKKVAGGQGSLSPGEEKGKALDQMSASERRDHSRKHSRVHSRNLSVFFPRPGTEAEVESDLAKAKDVFGSTTTSNDNSPGHLSIDTTGIDKGRNTLNVPNGNGNGIGTISPTQSRRGHHHKHSVVFSTNESLLSPLSPNHNHNHNHGNGSGSASDDDQLSSNDLSSPIGKLHSHQHSHHHHHDHSHQHQHQPTLTPLNYSKAYSTTSNHDSHPLLSSIPYLRNVPSNLIPSLTFGFLHFLLGSSLWVSGQSNDSLSVTGLGYLVVFDSFGILSLVVSELKSFGRSNLGLEDNRGESIRKPFSSHRLSVLLHFTQSIYLLFAAVYVCKESVEHALLEGSDSEEHAHSAAHKESDGIILPWFLLLLATLFCVASNVLFGNHAKLVAACGISTTSTSTPIHRGHGRQTSVLTSSSNLAGPFANLLSNPFSLTVFFFCSTLLFASLTMPPFQASALDKVLAGMESAAMAYIAYPASKALGKVLLQTAPEGGESNALNGLKRAVKIIEEHPLVTFVAPPHIWQLTPPTSALSAPLGSNPNNNPLASSLALGTAGSRGAKSAALVATLQIFIKPESSDSDCLDITRWAWERAAPSIGAGAGLKAGDNLRGSIMAGELVVQVEREGVKEEENLKNPAALEQHSHSHDHHHHDHSHHNHSHHDHSHHHHHHHDHDHSHSHGQSHGHDHSSHSHEHSTHSHHH